MGLILDASVVIAAERRRFAMERFLAAVDDSVALAAITASEMLHGVERATDPMVRHRRAAFVEDLLDTVPILEFGLAEARVHARLWATLAARGIRIGPHDLLVAATAISAGASVATLNAAEFGRVPDLSLVPVDAYSVTA